MAKTSDVHHYDDVPFEIPSSWEWTIVSEISTSILYGVSESAKAEGNYKLLRITDIQDNRVDWDSVPFTEFEENKAISYLLQNNDILFARTGATVGKSYLVRDLTQKAIYASYLIRVQTSKMVLPSYVKFFFESGYYWNQIGLKSIGIGQPNVNGTILGDLSIPIPPLSEQHRIVTEIEKWFSLIDIIESSKNDLQSTIKQTKSKILDLAIHGKLVPQNPKDEPAIELLKHIKAGKEKLIKDGKIKKSVKTSDAPHYENMPFEIPSSWVWTIVSEISNTILYGVSESAKAEGTYKLLRITDIQDNRVDWESVPFTEFDENKAKSYLLQNNDILFARTGATVGKSYLVQDLTQSYVKYFFESGYYWEQIGLKSVGIGQPNVNGTILGYLSIPLPPLAEQQRIVTKIEELFAVLDNIQKSIEV